MPLLRERNKPSTKETDSPATKGLPLSTVASEKKMTSKRKFKSTADNDQENMQADDLNTNSQPSVRRSHRAKIKPVHFEPGQGETTRNNNFDDSVGMEHDDEEEASEKSSRNTGTSSSAEGSEDENVETPKPHRGSKRKAKTTSAVKQSRKKILTGDFDFTGLFEAVKSGDSAFQPIIDQWIDGFKSDNCKGLSHFMTFLIQCCGCHGTVSEEMLQSLEIDDAIQELAQTFGDDSGDYPLKKNVGEFRRFRAHLTEFLQKFVSKCQNEIIYDEYFTQTLIDWLTALSSSQIRGLRHTSTFIGMKFVSYLINVAVKVRENVERSQKQLDAEKKKVRPSSSKVQQLEGRSRELHQNLMDIETMMENIFNGIFIHRYRDIAFEIRSICVEEYGYWLANYTAHFLSDQYLKYLGWSLNDKIGEVRLYTVRALKTLFADVDNAPHLELFGSRFKDRICEMASDIDDNVAAEAIRLCEKLYSFELLDKDDTQPVIKKVFVTKKAVRKAAGTFLTKILEQNLDTEKMSEEEKGKALFKDLISHYASTGFQSQACFLVDGVWNHLPRMADWRLMTDMLLSERDLDGKSLPELTEEEEISLVMIMTSCARKAVGDREEISQVPRKLTSKEKESFDEARESLSLHFMKMLPLLLSKFATDDKKTAYLCELPKLFDLPVYTKHRLSKPLEDLLKAMKGIYLKSSDTDVLRSVSSSLAFLKDTDLSLKSTVDNYVDQITDSLCAEFTESLADGYGINSNGDDVCDNQSMSSAVRRLFILYEHHNLSNLKIIDDMMAIISEGTSEGTHVDILVPCIKIAVLHILQKLSNVAESETPTPEELSEIMELRNALLNELELMMTHSEVYVEETAYKAICDILTLFSPSLKQDDIAISPLGLEAHSTLKDALSNYMKKIADASELNLEHYKSPAERQGEALIRYKRDIGLQFFKLVVSQILKANAFSPFLSLYVTQNRVFGELVKHVLAKTKETSQISHYRMVSKGLQIAFEDCKSADRTMKFADVKELARKISLTYGFENTKIRQAIVGIFRDGISYCIPCPDGDNIKEAPPKIEFLEVLRELSPKLTNQDVLHVSKFLAEKMEKYKPSEKKNSWGPYYLLVERLKRSKRSRKAGLPKPEPKVERADIEEKAEDPNREDENADNASETMTGSEESIDKGKRKREVSASPRKPTRSGRLPRKTQRLS